MLPYLLELDSPSGAIRIPTYGTMMVLAFTFAFLLVHRRARKVGIHPDRLVPIYGAAAVGGLVGARLLYMIAVEPSALIDPSRWLSSGGFAFYGGLLGGAGGVFALARWQQINGWKLADLLAPALVLGLGVGRLGCFFSGCCHGAVAPTSGAGTTLVGPDLLHGRVLLDGQFPFLTTEFHAGVGRLLDVPLYPTQLWSAAAGLGVASLLAFVWTRRRFDGQVVALMLLIEPVFRILIESFRADHRGYAVQFDAPAGWVERLPPGLTRAGAELGDAAVVGLTTSQTLGLGMVLLGAVLLVVRRNRGVAPEVPIEEDDF